MVRVGLRTTEIAWKITFPKLRSSFVSPLLDTLNTKESKTRVRRNTRPGKSKKRWASTYFHLLGSPWIKVHGFYSRYMDTQVSMYPGTADTKKNTKIPWRPSWPCRTKNKKNYPPGSKIFLAKNAKPVTEDERRPSIFLSPFAPQSEQYLFSSSFSNSDKIVWFEFCFCSLSLCALEDIIKGKGRR